MWICNIWVSSPLGEPFGEAAVKTKTLQDTWDWDFEVMFLQRLYNPAQFHVSLLWSFLNVDWGWTERLLWHRFAFTEATISDIRNILRIIRVASQFISWLDKLKGYTVPLSVIPFFYLLVAFRAHELAWHEFFIGPKSGISQLRFLHHLKLGMPRWRKFVV